MTRLADALGTLHLEGEVSMAGRWLELRGERATVYVAEASWGRGFYTWCDDPGWADPYWANTYGYYGYSPYWAPGYIYPPYPYYRY